MANLYMCVLFAPLFPALSTFPACVKESCLVDGLHGGLDSSFQVPIAAGILGYSWLHSPADNSAGCKAETTGFLRNGTEACTTVLTVCGTGPVDE